MDRRQEYHSWSHSIVFAKSWNWIAINLSKSEVNSIHPLRSKTKFTWYKVKLNIGLTCYTSNTMTLTFSSISWLWPGGGGGGGCVTLCSSWILVCIPMVLFLKGTSLYLEYYVWSTFIFVNTLVLILELMQARSSHIMQDTIRAQLLRHFIIYQLCLLYFDFNKLD